MSTTHHTSTIGFYLTTYVVIFTAIMVIAIAAEAFFIK
jgi:hypothetical protein